jgi:hypothetical protein
MITGSTNTYCSSWNALETWCTDYGLDSTTPMSEDTIAQFFSHRSYIRNLSTLTIPSMISAFKKVYEHRQWPWVETYRLRGIIKGLTNARASSDIREQAYPISYAEISTTLKDAYGKSSEFRKIVVWTQILVAFYGALRQGDIFTPPILMKHISFTDAGHLIITRIGGDKTNRDPITIKLIPNIQDHTCCPVLATTKLMLLQQNTQDITNLGNRKLFPESLTSNRGSSREYLVAAVERVIGYKIKSHGFRRGRISHLAATNVPDMEIRHISRHSHQSQAFSTYIDFASLDFPIEQRDSRAKYKRALPK